ncbi:MAG: anti-sigma factor [Chthoniobacterales bacterium]
MISEEQQEQAALYALDSLSAEEAAGFERSLSGNPELQALVRELRDAAGALALAAPMTQEPSTALKARIMQQIAAEAAPADAPNVIRPPAATFGNWLPWAIAAGLMIGCGVLALDRAKLQEQLVRAETPPVLAAPTLVALAPAEGAPPKAQAVVSWDESQQVGTIKIRNLPAADRGKDYQLWAVDSAHKNPVSAGIVRVDASGSGQVVFKPTEAAREVKAFALSLEVEGGVPKREGPILLIGTA